MSVIIQGKVAEDCSGVDQFQSGWMTVGNPHRMTAVPFGKLERRDSKSPSPSSGCLIQVMLKSTELTAEQWKTASSPEMTDTFSGRVTEGGASISKRSKTF